MEAHLTFQIECGKTTCASSPGNFCRFLLLGLGGSGRCHFFGNVYEDKPGGSLQRHPDCIKHSDPVIDTESRVEPLN